MKNASFLYFDLTNKVSTSKDKFYSAFKIQPRFHAKGGFGDISVLQKYKKSSLELVHLSSSGPWTLCDKSFENDFCDLKCISEFNVFFFFEFKHYFGIVSLIGFVIGKLAFDLAPISTKVTVM